MTDPKRPEDEEPTEPTEPEEADEAAEAQADEEADDFDDEVEEAGEEAAPEPAKPTSSKARQDHDRGCGRDGRAALRRRPRLEDLGRAHRLRFPRDPVLRPLPGDGRFPEPEDAASDRGTGHAHALGIASTYRHASGERHAGAVRDPQGITERRSLTDGHSRNDLGKSLVRRWMRRSSEYDWIADQLERRGIRDQDVLRVMRAVPREKFVPADVRHQAYRDGALPIGHGQTISQPYIVARMTESLALPEWRDAHNGEQPRVLDVGTGSGYQAAVLAEMGAQVISIELEPSLADRARATLRELGYDVEVRVGDGSAGAPQDAPFAGIMVAAAAPQVPVPLVEQLLPDGRLVIPIGTRWEQVITLVRPTGDGFAQEPVEPAVFVPLLGEHGFSGDRT